MTTEAQNALLKSLEEPPADTVIILTATSLRALLPTITSRTQHLRLETPALEAFADIFFTGLLRGSNIQHAYRLSGGLPGLMSVLLESDETHPLVAAVESRAMVWLCAQHATNACY